MNEFRPDVFGRFGRARSRFLHPDARRGLGILMNLRPSAGLNRHRQKKSN